MKKLLLLSIVILFAFAPNSYASHVMGADITYTCIGGNQYQVTLSLYRDCFGSTIGTTPQTVDIASSCGNVAASLNWVSTTNVSQVCSSSSTTCDGGSLPGTEQYVFTGIVTLPPCNDWVMSWSLCCRNATINNLVTPDSWSVYVETTLNNVLASCNNSPQFLSIPTPYLCSNQLTIYNHGASDADGDSLYYQFTTPLDGPGAPIGFNLGYSQADPIITSAGMNLNPETGEMCFTPSQSQICVVAVKIYEYRNNVLIGTYIREMQVVVVNGCTNSAPSAGGGVPTCGNVGGISNLTAGPTVVQQDANSFSICPFDQICFDVSFLDPNGDLITVNSNIASAIPGATFNITNNNTNNPIGHFCWTPTPLDSGKNILTVHVNDNACPISASQYYTYDITVFDQPYAGPDQIICGPQWAQLNASGGAGYTWSVLSGSPLNPGVNITCNPCANPQVKPTVTTTYVLTSTLTAACINTDTITITVVPDYFVIPFGDTTLCDYLSTPIGVNVVPAMGTYTYSWSNASTLNNSTISNPSASPTATTTYVATVTSPFGCVKKDSVTVNVNPPPTLNLTPGDTGVCLGSSLNFDIQSTCAYTLEMFDSFGDGWNGQTISVYDNGVFVGTYTVLGTDNNGDWNTVTFPITNGNTISIINNNGTGFPYPDECSFNLINGLGVTQFSVAPFNMTSIDGETIYNGIGNCGPTLSNYTFSWSPSSGLSSTTIQNPVAAPLTTTTYTVTLTDASGCTVNRSQTITVVPNYTLTTTQSDNTVCLGETVNFTVSTNPVGVYNYSWTPATIMDNPNSSTPTATFTTPGLNTVIVNIDNGGGCMKSDTMYVTVSPSYAPNINIINNDTTISCNGNVPINLSLGGGIPATCGASSSTACSGPTTPRTVGTATGANGTSTYPAPYGNYWKNAKHQFLYTAAELNALGFIGGKITQIGWEVTAINGTTAYNSYTIKMKCTGATSLTAWETGLTQVFNPKTVNIVTGYNMHTLDVAYEWDGISNLIVEICYDNLATSYTNNSITPWTTTSFVSSIYYYSDSSPACPITTTSGNSTNRPVTRFTTCPTTPNPAAFTYSWTPTLGVSDPSIQNPVLSPGSTTTYTVTVTDPVGGCFDTDSITITTNSDATLLLSSASGTDAQTVCINSAITNISYTINGGGTGATISGLPTGVTGSFNAGIYTITGTPSETGIFTYMINTTGTCQQLADTGIITIIPDAIISLSSAVGTDAQTVCINSAITNITYNIGGGGTNAIITGLPTGVTGTYSAGVFTISGTPTTIGTFNYTINTIGSCIQISAIGSITLLDSLHLSPINLSSDSICPNDTTSISANPATGGSGVGYTYTWYDSHNNVVGTGLNIIVKPTTNIETYTLVVGDNCTTPSTSQSVIVYWLPLPKPSFMVINTAGCYPVLASFMNTTPNSASINSVQWNFGDGQTSNNIVNSDHSYTTPGCFDVNLSVTSIAGCFRDTTLQSAVCAYDYPIADFTMSPQPTDVTNPFISFTNQSYGNTENFWSFTNGIPSYSLDVNPISEFPSDTPGTYLVELAIANSHGCPDTITRTVVIDGLYLFYIPNTFTPNGDDKNDFFRPYGDGVDWSKYHFMIFDRWGEKVFETDNVEEGWDGTYKGNPAQSGVYIWKIKAKELYRNVNTEHSGHVNLIR